MIVGKGMQVEVLAGLLLVSNAGEQEYEVFGGEVLAIVSVFFKEDGESFASKHGFE